MADVERLAEPDRRSWKGRSSAARSMTGASTRPRRALSGRNPPHLPRGDLFGHISHHEAHLDVLKVRVIPCLDVKDGRVVKGVNFVGLRDAGDPVECARAYDAAGADELCFLDITASHENRGTMLDVVARTAEVCFMPLTVGGGVRSVEDIRACCSPAPTRSRSTPPP